MASLGRRGTIAVGISGLLVVAAAGAAVPLLHLGSSPTVASPAGPSASPTRTTPPPPVNQPLAVGSAFLAAWQRGDYGAMQTLVLNPADSMQRAYGGLATRLGVAAVTATPGTLDPTGTRLAFRARLSLTGLGNLAYSGLLPLAVKAGRWKVAFTAATLYPGLAYGQRLDLVAPDAPPPQILDRSGAPLATDHDLALNLLGSPARTGTRVSAATGLYRVLATRSPATPARTTVAVVDALTGLTVRTVLAFRPTPVAEQVRTTLDLRIQRAATRALASASGTAALVVLDTATGEVRALANKPVSGLPVAIAGAYPPGSTFKIVTSTAALLNGSTPASGIACPTTIVEGGVRFHNDEVAPDRTLTLTQAFAQSCNTAFIHLASTLPVGSLDSAAALYGFNAGDPLPISAVGGSIPPARSAGEAAADAIGQGRVTASPLQLASVAAAVASGAWHQPHVLACPDCLSHMIPVAASLRPMMRAVVTSGTGIQALGVPGGPVYGKTGTAEFGTGAPPPTHAWFIGYQGTLAFAVFVDRGSTGGAVAAPIAATLLRLLA